MTLAERLLLDPFQGYAYSYPHKMAYRPLDPLVELRPLWEEEDRSALFLYLHIPFCEVRCGFCNLFTSTSASEATVTTYLATLRRQSSVIKDVLGECRFAKAAIGGGTPSFLDEGELEELFDIVEIELGGITANGPISFEVSPSTVDEGKLRFLKERGVTRISIGVQSFLEAETRALGRPQNPAVLQRALESIRGAGFPVMNIDLIYGAQGQTPRSWGESLARTLEFHPEEIYLYPLYVRPMTGLHRIGRDPSDLRYELYLQGRDVLLASGYEQISMRLFRRSALASGAVAEGPVYCCQEDGMVGLGAGARSYTSRLHYSSEYAVGQSGVRAILADYCRRGEASFARADYGCRLDEHERKRRYVIKSLLRKDGLDGSAYRAEFATSPWEDIPALEELAELGLAKAAGERLLLTQAGLDRSDTIGPWLFSEESCRRMEEFAVA